MDPIHIFQVSILSKFINEPSNLLSNPWIIVCIIVYVISKMVPFQVYNYMELKLMEIVWKENISSILISYHIKSYTCYGASKPVEKILYSDRFRAINYYIKKYHLNKIYSLTEIINFENSRYVEGDSDFILLPKHNQKIKIDEKEEIYFETFLDIKRDFDPENKNKSEPSQISTKKYIYKLSKNGRDSIQSLDKFLENVLKEYENEIVNKTIQMVFEYKKSVKDDEDKQTTLFYETPFKTNKSFDNIFFEGKKDFFDFISRFSDKENEKLKLQYEKSGNPYKAVILLHGDPGCGKSSLIKATIKHTGRHVILVPWTKIKTCQDFVSIFRPIKINNKTYNQNEVIIVFEDFDANENDVIKIREGLKQKKEELVEKIDKQKDKQYNEFLKMKMDDELTLEYILNVLDGPVELYDTIVFFTTNDLTVIDPALKRTGRVDRIIKMERATRKIIKEMIGHRFSVSVKSLDKYAKQFNKIPEYKIAYSDISQICKDSKSVEEFFTMIFKLK